MKYADTDMIFVRIIRSGFIPQLGICGPIPNPIKITRAKAKSLIVAGIGVWQVDPNTNEVTELTLQNVFGGSEPEKTTPEKVVAPAPEPKPKEFVGVQKAKENVDPAKPAVTNSDATEPVKAAPEKKEDAAAEQPNSQKNKNKNKK